MVIVMLQSYVKGYTRATPELAFIFPLKLHTCPVIPSFLGTLLWFSKNNNVNMATAPGSCLTSSWILYFSYIFAIYLPHIVILISHIVALYTRQIYCIIACLSNAPPLLLFLKILPFASLVSFSLSNWWYWGCRTLKRLWSPLRHICDFKN